MSEQSRAQKLDRPIFSRSAGFFWPFAVLTLMQGNAIAQQSTGDELQVLEMRTKAEFLDPEERISGGAVVGVIFYDQIDSVSLDAAYVYLAEPVSSNLEMQLATIDGRYLATFDYIPDKPIRGWVRLNLSLSRPDFLDNYSLSEIALLMTSAEGGTAHPVRWGEQSQAEFLRVYVNTEGAKAYFSSFDSEKGRMTARSCVKASRKSSFKFDRVCDVPVADAEENNDINIIRKQGAGFGTPIQLAVSLQAPASTE